MVEQLTFFLIAAGKSHYYLSVIALRTENDNLLCNCLQVHNLNAMACFLIKVIVLFYLTTSHVTFFVTSFMHVG